MSDLQQMISEYKAERQYAWNEIFKAQECGNYKELEKWEIIAQAFGDLVGKLTLLLNTGNEKQR